MFLTPLTQLLASVALFKRPPGMTGLSLANPWHAARNLLYPEVPENLLNNRLTSLADSRQLDSIIDELIPMGPKFVKSKYRSVGPLFKRTMDKVDPLQDLDPKYFVIGKQIMHSWLNNISAIFEKPVLKKNEKRKIPIVMRLV